jgi:hypothetical protein
LLISLPIPVNDLSFACSGQAEGNSVASNFNPKV